MNAISAPAAVVEREGTDVAWIGILAAAGMLAVALIVAAGRYGPHRDEPYFVAAGGHHALGYPDQPLLTPLLAWSVNAVDHGSLLILRAPAILAGAVSTVTTGLLARELLDNREQGVPVRLCTGLRHPWPRMWHALRHYD